MSIIKMYEEFSQEIDIDVEEIKEIFQYIVDDWDLFDLSDGEQKARGQDCKIEYLYFYYPLEYYGGYYTDIHALLSYHGRKETIGQLQRLGWKKAFGIYINLAGPNDFFRTRNDFLENLNPISDRILKRGYKCDLLQDRYNSNKFVLFIQNKLK